MKERPILFSAPMVRALLDGSKTQTRRVVKPQHLKFFEHSAAEMLGAWDKRPMPHGHPGDRLWVREAWRGIVQINGPHEAYSTGVARYVPDQEYCKKVEFAATDEANGEPWRPSIHMPRWASRITLEITSVRVERLQDISEADAMAEGIPADLLPLDVARMPYPSSIAAGRYAALWESINGPGSWDANPWVWVVEFKRVGQ